MMRTITFYVALFVFCTNTNCFAELIKDSVENKNKLNYSLGLSFYSSRQFDLTGSIIYKKHIFELGIIFGPTFTFKKHESGQDNPFYDYLVLKDMDFSKFSLHGISTAYKYNCFSTKHFVFRIVLLTELSEYQGYYYKDLTPLPYEPIFIKQQIHVVAGYNISVIFSDKIELGFNFLPGVKYYWDKQIIDPNYPQSNPPSPREYHYEKFLPSCLLKLDLKYQFKR